MQDLFENNGARFSECRKYRYALWRIWDESKPLIMFIGLNPSKANETKPDPTITRVLGFAKDWGYGGFYMVNIFALVSSKPEVLTTCADPVGPENNFWLNHIGTKCKDVICAWGAFKEAKTRAEQVRSLSLCQNAKALIINQDGSPRHPLYVKGNVIPVDFK